MEESLRRTGYRDPPKVNSYRKILSTEGLKEETNPLKITSMASSKNDGRKLVSHAWKNKFNAKTNN
jgi:hypothetical protein